jgi:hypothetical protein
MASAQQPTPAVVTQETTLNKMLDEEAAKLPFLRRKIAQRLLADPDKREEIVERVTLKLSETKKLKPMQATFEAEEFSGNTPMALSPELKQIIMDILKQLLPLLLSMIFKV